MTSSTTERAATGRRAATPASPLDRARGHVRRLDLATYLLLAACVLYGAYLVWLSSDAWFWGDDWTFLFHKGTIPGETQGTLMDAYNGHWSLAHGLTYRVLFDLFGMKTYLPWLIVLIGFHVAIVLAVHVLLRRTGCPRSVALGTALAILFTGVAPEMLVYDAAMSHSGALAFGLAGIVVVVVTDAARRGLVLAAVLLSVALMFSATGISTVVLAAVFVSVHWSVSAGLRVAGPPAAVFVAWFAVWGRSGAGGADRTFGNLADVPNYVWDGLTKVFGSAVGVPGVGPVVFAALILNLLTDREGRPALRTLAWSGLAAATAQLVLEGVGRLNIGDIDNSPARYAYFSLVLLSPALALGVARLMRATVEPRWLPVAGISLALVGYAVHGVSQVRDFSEGYSFGSKAWLGRFHGMMASADADQRQITTSYDDFVNVGITQDLIARPEVREVLPAGEASMHDRLTAETMFNVGVGTQEYDLFNPAYIDLAFGWNRKIRKLPGCATYTATVPNPMLQVATLDGIEIGVNSGATEITTRLVRDDVVGDGRIWQVAGGDSIHIASTAKDALLQVSFNAPGEYVICKQ
ncbi:hypothetical protein J2X46_003553 [Nocardioides sp. BE266]|uniref:hypothetical protein n=1 Tax=Nocardioides sp. BE266 TaxID=2817725 RepID=UPI00285DC6FC|nr:hypothetical protein [Nocardioides sp. BE266]MDR7254560.1 hypothetical protein [Nocardioides sp. BE266]